MSVCMHVSAYACVQVYECVYVYIVYAYACVQVYECIRTLCKCIYMRSVRIRTHILALHRHGSK